MSSLPYTFCYEISKKKGQILVILRNEMEGGSSRFWFSGFADFYAVPSFVTQITPIKAYYKKGWQVIPTISEIKNVLLLFVFGNPRNIDFCSKNILWGDRYWMKDN